jgi:Family of unknown function (DUF6328)
MSSSDANCSEEPPEALHDERDRAELRDRYYGLIQELRIVLPGVQVLVAFLLTAPFASRFGDLDDFGRGLFGGALFFSMLSVAAFVSPTGMHRFGRRTARAARLQFSIVMTRIGLLCLAAGLTLALWLVSRFLFTTTVTVLLVGTTFAVFITLWVLVPLLSRFGAGEDE